MSTWKTHFLLIPEQILLSANINAKHHSWSMRAEGGRCGEREKQPSGKERRIQSEEPSLFSPEMTTKKWVGCLVGRAEVGSHKFQFSSVLSTAFLPRPHPCQKMAPVSRIVEKNHDWHVKWGLRVPPSAFVFPRQPGCVTEDLQTGGLVRKAGSQPGAVWGDLHLRVGVLPSTAPHSLEGTALALLTSLLFPEV